jgi:hypothetical protein
MECCVIVDEVIGYYVWLRTDFPTKRVSTIPYTKCDNYCTDSLLGVRVQKNLLLPPRPPTQEHLFLQNKRNR